MLLYRPVGLLELALIYDKKMRAFPPRLPEQPIFYPVLNIEYARAIAFQWNAPIPPYAGYVTAFTVEDDYVSQFETHIVGAKRHAELWVPAEEVEKFNSHIIDLIQLVDARFGKQFTGYLPERGSLKDKNALDQLIFLINKFISNPIDAAHEITVNHKSVFLNYPYWQMADGVEWGIVNEERRKGLADIRSGWLKLFPEIHLGM